MKVDIISGFLGAGKTTFINWYLPLLDGKVALIENEFGDTSIDTALIETDLPVKEIFAGCICCTLRGDFASGIREIYETYSPDRLVIEPSGVGKLSDVVGAVEDGGRFGNIDLEICNKIVLVDVDTFEDYYENFGPFYIDQIKNANLIFLTFMEEASDEQIAKAVRTMKDLNPEAIISSVDYREMGDEALMDLVAMTRGQKTCSSCQAHHHGHTCNHDHDHDHHHEDAGGVFSSISIDSQGISENSLRDILAELEKQDYGYVLRAKGFIEDDGINLLNYNPTKTSIEKFTRSIEDKDRIIVLIGTNLNREGIESLFDKKKRG